MENVRLSEEKPMLEKDCRVECGAVVHMLLTPTEEKLRLAELRS